MINKFINYFVKKLKKSHYVQSLFFAPINIKSMPVFGIFTDSYGNIFKLYSGFRTKLKPDWKSFVENQGKKFQTNIEFFKNNKKDCRLALNRIIPIAYSYSKIIENSNILELGCHLGGVSYCLAEMGAKEVYSTDFAGYKASAADSNNNSEKTLIEIDNELNTARTEYAKLFKNNSAVKFLNDDICNSKLPESHFDLIISFDVLEHISNTEQAFANISRILKDDGIAIHEYNPFFSLNGGHSACTLDFPWGHTRLSESDFLRYVKEIRPDEENLDMSFYKNGLNRMSIDNLIKISKKNNLEILSLIQFTKEQHIGLLNDEIFSQSKKVYPDITIADLVTPRIIIVHKKRI
ncbi:MAG: hypothetical protein A2046_04695 [Bacteroidetes bacterium GWA2_30_7]|nr:MAG: hypothetical protein A2046_04695 [Bacteroidetes bacterium GWA2_30_7]